MQSTCTALHVGVGIVVAIFCCIGISTFYFVGGKAENFFVAVREAAAQVEEHSLMTPRVDLLKAPGLSTP